MTVPLFDVQAAFGGVAPGKRETFTADALLAEMDRLQIGKAMARIWPDELDMDAVQSNRILHEACAASAGRLVPCPVLIPSAGGEFPPEAEQVERAIARGAGSRYDSLRTHLINGDFQFVLIDRIATYDLDLTFRQKLVINLYNIFKRIAITEAKALNLDTSNVLVEKVPLTGDQRAKRKIQRVVIE